MKLKHLGSADESVENLILSVRIQRVILDADLARVCGMPTKQLNQAVRRNPGRFPEDFALELQPQELATLRSQIVTSKRRGGRRYVPLAFTEHGAIMAANVLNSRRAVHMSIFVVRAFVKMRAALAQNKEPAAKLAELERKLTARLDKHEHAIVAILDEIKKLRAPPSGAQRREFGFHVRDQSQAASTATNRMFQNRCT